MNILFEYLYRDAGNFKNWGEVVFSNSQNLSISTISQMTERRVHDTRTFFSAEKAGVPDLHFKEYNEKLDHDWHEIYDFHATEDVPNDTYGRDIDQFMESLQRATLL